MKRTLSIIAVAAVAVFGANAASAAPASPASTLPSGIQSAVEKTGHGCHRGRGWKSHKSHKRSARVIRSERMYYRGGPAVKVKVDKKKRKYHHRRHHDDRHIHRRSDRR